MATLSFEEVTRLVNLTRTTSISDKPRAEGSGWRLYDGRYKVHAAEMPFEVLYLESKATQQNGIDAKLRLSGKSNVHVVYAESVGFKPKALFESVALCLSIKDYLKSFIGSELDEYRTQLIARAPKDFVPPQLILPSSITSIAAQYPLERFFTDPPGAEGSAASSCAVLLAAPGQGKTFMAEFLVSMIAKKNSYVPLYVSSAQWTTMRVGDLSSIAKTITNSFSYFQAQIGWLHGYEEQFLRTTLKAGHFCIVFDGFDEYILRNNGAVTALDVLQTLKQLADDTDSRLLVTSRTTFWHADVENSGDNGTEIGRSYLNFELMPFDVSHAEKYFKLRMKDNDDAIRIAKKLFEKLRSANADFAGKGFTLKLIGDIAENKPSVDTAIVGHPGVWLLEQICEREQLRQNLPLNSEQQLLGLRYTASQQLKSGRLTEEEVQLGIEMAAPQLDPQAVQNCVQRLGSHPLIERREEWKFTQDQVRILLVASHLLAEIKSDKNLAEIEEISRFGDVPAQDVADIAEAIIDLIMQAPVPESAQLNHVIRALAAHSCVGGRLPENKDFSRRLTVQVILAIVERRAGRGSTREERASVIEELMEGRVVSGLVFGPSIPRINFSGFTFENCVFDNVQWQYCKFDETTVFTGCRFLGGGESYCDGLDLAEIREYVADEAGSEFIEGLQIQSGRRIYSADNLRNDIRAIIRKFVSPDGLHFKSVSEVHVTSGSVSRSRHKDEIMRELCRCNINEHEISGVSSKGYHVRDDAKEAVRFMAVNNSLSGVLAGVFERLSVRLLS
ncbi:MAG: hypothetical protein AzoDbin1_02577 [Azoarcus sp.]|nr:hypothetical protein [Azoarcus sp.]